MSQRNIGHPLAAEGGQVTQRPPCLVREENTSGSEVLGGVPSRDSGGGTGSLWSGLDSVVKLPAFPTLHLAEHMADSVSESTNMREKGF